MIFVLLLFVGLAVDVGNVYAERRHMQNAADAGALAGARAICYGDPPDPIYEAQRYAIQENGADKADVRIFEGYKVEVVASVAAETYFIRLIPGLETVDVSAIAVAGCGPGEGVCAGFPVAFHVDLWCTLAKLVGCMPVCPPSPCCGEYPLPDGESPCESTCEGRVFYIWDDPWDVDHATVDITGDGIEDLVIGSGHRRWLDFGKPPDEYSSECGGCGNVKCLIEHGYAGPVNIGDCISAKPGVVDSALQNAPVGKMVPIPLYEETCDYAAACGKPGIVVKEFACIKIMGRYDVLAEDSWDGKKHRVIKFHVVCDPSSCPNPCAGTAGEQPGPGSVTGVSLLE
jgi:hypothetical protein